MTLLRWLLVASTSAAAAGVTGQSASSDERTLLALHATILRAHREGDLPAWSATESDRFVLVHRGEISHPTKAERERVMAPYLKSTKFLEYRDVATPIVRISKDGSLAWLIAQVRGAGIQTDASAQEKPLEFICAWIELYEKQGGRWVCVGNVSSFKE